MLSRLTRLSAGSHQRRGRQCAKERWIAAASCAIQLRVDVRKNVTHRQLSRPRTDEAFEGPIPAAVLLVGIHVTQRHAANHTPRANDYVRLFLHVTRGVSSTGRGVGRELA